MSTQPVAAQLRVAFATSDGESVNQHFGSTRGLSIYEVGPATSNLVERADFEKTLKDGNEDKLREKMERLKQCDVVYCGQVGQSAARQLLALNVQPLAVRQGPAISQLIERLQEQLRGESQEPWLDRVLKQRSKDEAPDRELSLDEDWNE